ncbi:MAG: hypothetical protein J4G18_10655, partial [Anaerolineae bacterium]|nr:hypothetical protein [Anaerolineae bacterium]
GIVDTIEFKNREALIIDESRLTLLGGNAGDKSIIMAGIHQVATGEGALNLRFKLPADFKINPLIDSRVSVTWGEPAQQTTAAVSGDSVSIPLQLSAEDSFVMADVTLYYCREGEEALCFIDVFNYFVTLEVAAEHEIREITLEREVEPPGV